MKLNITKLFLGAIITSLAFTACKKTFLDSQPLTQISDATVWSNPSAIEAYSATIYDAMPVEDFSYQPAEEASFPSTWVDEAVRSYTWGPTNNIPIPDEAFGWWGYKQLRDVNYFMASVKGGNISEDLKARYIAEAHFIRAFDYFAMVKRYGGVPILKEALQYTGSNLADLQLPRDKEQDVYDFIAADCDTAIASLPESYGADNTFRATKYAAMALKCRAMLYAASEAAYGQVQLNGLVGIPAQEANAYWQKAYDAANAIIQSGTFSLFNAIPDKAENFQQLFLTKTGNPEVIFAKGYSPPKKGHSWDFYNAPQSFCINYGSATNPTQEMVEEFEYTDGLPGTLHLTDNAGNPIHFTNPADLFKNKDPRFFATILYPNAPWQGNMVEVRGGIIDAAGNKITSGNLTDVYENSNITITGKDGPVIDGDPTKTGYYIKKYMDPVNRLDDGQSSQSWIIFRYGEILLNFAEAAMALGKSDEALDAINQIRDRAGIAKLASVDMDKIRHERKVELAFENHRYWDIRRWKIADQLLNNTQFHGLWPWLNWKDMTYTFEVVPAKNARTFYPRLYYEEIDQDDISTNPKLVQNPLY